MHPDDSLLDVVPEPRLDDATSQEQLPPAENGHVAFHAVHVDPPEHLTGQLDDDTAPPAGLDLRLAGIESALADVAQRLAGESDRAAARERVIDRQHEDIERLRSVERVGQLRPVVTDLYQLRNDLLRQAGRIPAEMTGPKVAELLDSFAATVEEALERCGITVLPREVGGAFVPGHQQIAAVVEIDDAERDGTVAGVVQDGYAEIDGGKVVAPARITLYRYMTKEKTDG
ncbi:MAG: nucleotide exchange factor GrpE [Pseudonocardia sp.]